MEQLSFLLGTPGWTALPFPDALDTPFPALFLFISLAFGSALFGHGLAQAALPTLTLLIEAPPL